MSRNAVIVHGKPPISKWEDPTQPRPHEANWLPWIGAELEAQGMEVAIPAFPEPYAPDYAAWKSVLEDQEITSTTTLIGHSAGAGFILRYLSENPRVEVDRIALVAPWLVDPEDKYGDWTKFAIDPILPVSVRTGMDIFYSSQDNPQAQDSLKIVREALPIARYRDIPAYGHFMIGNSMENEQFPELRDALINPSS